MLGTNSINFLTLGSYSHSPRSGLERGMPSIEDFYRDDELKYHGKKNRGVMTIDFTGEPFKRIRVFCEKLVLGETCYCRTF